MAPVGRQPSQVSIGKKPMAYPTTQPQATQAPAKSARAASKAPIPPNAYNNNTATNAHHHPSPPPSKRPPATTAPSTTKANKIWSTSSTEERERIKDFWLGLGEEERRNLVKIEKDTVLRKMKEQQKHSCSCAVCGRKRCVHQRNISVFLFLYLTIYRNAIEEELEVLYDAYYEELEQYAHLQQRYVSSGGPPPPGPGPFPGSVELDKHGAVINHSPKKTTAKRPQPVQQQQQQRKSGVVAPPPTPNRTKQRHKHPSEFDDDDEEEEGEEEEDEEEDEYEVMDEEEGDDEYEEDDEEEEAPPAKVKPPAQPQPPPAKPARDGLFSLGSSLTVTGPGNILTVADDLLKNDGQKFLEMMEQLAERRMQREEEAAGDVESDSEDDDEEEEEDEDGEGDEDDEDDEDDDEEDDEEEEEVRLSSLYLTV